MLVESVSAWKEISLRKETLAFGRKRKENIVWKEIGRKSVHREGKYIYRRKF